MRVHCTKLFDRVVQSESKVSRSSYFRKKLVGIFTNFIIFGLWAVTSQTFAKKIMTGLPNLPSTVSEIFKNEKLLTRKIFPISFWLWANDFRASGQKIRKVNQNCTLCVQRRFSKEKTFKLKTFFSISFWIWADDFRDSGGKCRKYHQSCILPVQVNILPEKSFAENEFNTCGFSGKKILRLSVGKCLEEISEGKNFAKRVIRILFWLWDRKFQIFHQKFLAELS